VQPSRLPTPHTPAPLSVLSQQPRGQRRNPLQQPSRSRILQHHHITLSPRARLCHTPHPAPAPDRPTTRPSSGHSLRHPNGRAHLPQTRLPNPPPHHPVPLDSLKKSSALNRKSKSAFFRTSHIFCAIWRWKHFVKYTGADPVVL